MLRIRCASTLLFLIVFAMGGSLSASELGEDGLHKQDWFSITFKDVAEDISEAASEDKRLAIVFEQRGCIYCQQLHEELLSDPDISSYIREHFNVVQINLFGDEEVIDIDGEELAEKAAAKKWDVVFTPTILFMPDTVPTAGDAGSTAVARIPGVFGKGTFLDMFRWIKQKGYAGDEHFQHFHARSIEERKAK